MYIHRTTNVYKIVQKGFDVLVIMNVFRESRKRGEKSELARGLSLGQRWALGEGREVTAQK